LETRSFAVNGIHHQRYSPSTVGNGVPRRFLDPKTNDLASSPDAANILAADYRPFISKDDGALLNLSDALSGLVYGISTEFNVTAHSRIDQVGIMI
jgi:hypothetical protein